MGRFVSQDPIGLNGGDNLYFYAINSLTWIDPFGLSPRRRRNPHPTNAQHHNKKKLCRVGSSGKIISSADARKIDYLFDNKNDAMNGFLVVSCGI